MNKRIKTIYYLEYMSFSLVIALICTFSGVQAQAQTKTCKFNFTNNTGEPLIRSISGPTYGAEEYSIVSNLPYSWQNGHTFTLTYEAELGVYAPTVLALGEIPTIDFSYSGTTGGPYVLEFAALPLYTNGKISVSASKCMIYDNGRARDIDVLDLCKGGNENGSPLFCTETGDDGLDVSISYGVYFLHYDKNYDPASKSTGDGGEGTTTSELPDPASLLQMQLLPITDPSSCITSSDLPYSFDVFVKPIGYDPGSGDIPALQYWEYSPDLGSIYMGNKGLSLDYCLGAAKASEGAEVRTDKCSNQQAKKWLFPANGQIKSKENTQLCLSQESDGKLRLRTCNDSNDQQKWKAELNSGALRQNISLRKSKGKCMYAEGWASDEDINIGIHSCEESEGQKWFIDGNSLKLSYQPDKCLDLDHSSTTNGTNIQLWECNGTDAQHWIYDVANQMIRSKINFNKCLDLVNGITINATNIQLYDCVYGNTKPNQQWIVDNVPSAIPTGKNLQVHVVAVPNKCLDVSNYNTANGTNIQLSECKDHPAQYFTFDGRAIKMQAHPDKCLDLTLSKTDNGKNIRLWDCNDTDAQHWIYDGFARAFRSAIDPGKCLDVKESNFTNATNIQLWDCNGTGAQQFEIY